MTLQRSLPAIVLPLIGLLAVGCGSSPTSSSGEDLGVQSSNDLAQRTGDLAGSPIDMAGAGATDLTPSLAGSCLPLADYCGYGGNFCVSNWTNAQIAAKWCVPGKDVDIFIPTSCTGGYRVITLGGANFYDNKQLFYDMNGDGALLAVVSVSEGPTYLCDAGDSSYATLMYNGCSYGQPAMCVNGVIQ